MIQLLLDNFASAFKQMNKQQNHPSREERMTAENVLKERWKPERGESGLEVREQGRGRRIVRSRGSEIQAEEERLRQVLNLTLAIKVKGETQHIPLLHYSGARWQGGLFLLL